MIKERYLYKLIPVKYCLNINMFPPKSEIIGFWGFVFKVFKIKWEMKIYRYYGNYFKGILNQYKFKNNKINCEIFKIK